MRLLLPLLLLLIAAAPAAAQTGASVVINEFCYDDYSTDDYEFVELYNTTNKAIDISGWILHSSDSNGPNNVFTIPKSTILKAGDYYVIGSPLVPNVDQVTSMATNIWQNSNEDLALWDLQKNVVDSVAYECNKGYWTGSREETEGIWGNGYGNQPADHYEVVLVGDALVTPVTTQAYGRGELDYDSTSGKVTIRIEVRGLTPTAVEFYQGKKGTTGTLIGALTGSGQVWTGSPTLTAAQATALQGGDTYILVKTATNPNGELRGQATALPLVSWSRFQDGLDTGNNGLDFGQLPSTPGMTNKPLGPGVNTYLETFDSFTPDTPAPYWSASFVAPHVVDPTKAGAFNPSVIAASPQGGNAVVFWDPAGGGDGGALHMTGPGGEVVLECYAYISSTLPPSGENETWSIGIGGTTGAYYNTPDPGGSLSFTANGNTGLSWTYQATSTGAVIYLVDHNDGGWGTGARSDAVVLGQVPIKKGVNDGWQRLRLERNGTSLVGTFGGQRSGGGGTWISANTTYTTNNWAVYIGYREALSANANARPLTIDMLLVRASNGAVTHFGQAAATTKGTPLLATDGPPTVGNSTFGLMLTGLVPSGNSVLLLGLGKLTPPLNLAPLGGQTGSFLYLLPFLPFPVSNSNQGQGKVALPIPYNPAMIGGNLYWQAFDLDPALTAPLKLGNTDAMETKFGN